MFDHLNQVHVYFDKHLDRAAHLLEYATIPFSLPVNGMLLTESICLIVCSSKVAARSLAAFAIHLRASVLDQTEPAGDERGHERDDGRCLPLRLYTHPSL